MTRASRTMIPLSLILISATAAADDVPAVVCEGAYPQHLQGICTDRQKSIFWSFTTKLVKTDLTGKVVKRVDVESHHGDLCFHQDKVYVAVNLGKFNDPMGHADSWVYVYDANDLTRVARHPVSEVFHGAGGIAVHDGRFLVVGGLPDELDENFVYEYTTGFQFVKKHTLSSGHTHLGIQTATFSEGQWWFGCYGRPRSATASAIPSVLLRADASLTRVERFEFDCSLGIVPAGSGTFWVARGGTIKGQGLTGRLVPVVPDADRGLKLLDPPRRDGDAVPR